MPEIQPFRGWRYDPGHVGNLSDVIAPPYDVIDAELQNALYARHPNNVVRLILNRTEHGDDEERNRYTRAGRLFRDWCREGVLRQERDPAIYVCQQTFTHEGIEYVRRGMLVRVRLEPLSTGRIFPHEETMPGPKADRLRLMHATHANLSPVFSLYPDATNAAQETLQESITGQPPIECRDHLGFLHRLWPVTDPATISSVQRLIHSQPAFIADGHHRYETALKYLEEMKQAGRVTSPDAPANFVMMMLTSMSDSGLLILPTHRVVSGLPNVTTAQLQEILAPYFELEPIGVSSEAAQAAWRGLEEKGGSSWLAFGTASDQTWLLARLRDVGDIQRRAPDHSADWCRLGVSVLQVLVLGELLPEALGTSGTCSYFHRVDEVARKLEAGDAQIGVLVPSATMADVERIAGRREKMPPKSTYFFPKVPSGLVINPLE